MSGHARSSLPAGLDEVSEVVGGDPHQFAKPNDPQLATVDQTADMPRRGADMLGDLGDGQKTRRAGRPRRCRRRRRDTVIRFNIDRL